MVYPRGTKDNFLSVFVEVEEGEDDTWSLLANFVFSVHNQVSSFHALLLIIGN